MTVCITGAADVITAVSVLSLALKLRGWVEVLVVVSHEVVGIMASAISFLASCGQHEKCEQVKAVISGWELSSVWVRGCHCSSVELTLRFIGFMSS